MSSSDSIVFVAFSNVATSPSMINSWQATSCVFAVIVGGSSFCVLSSWLFLLGSTWLTQTSCVSSCCFPLDFVCVAIDVAGVSFLDCSFSFRPISFLLFVMIACSVVLSPKMNLGKCDFGLFSSVFFCDISSLAS